MKTALAILQLIPALIEIIGAVEKLFPEGGKGQEKLELVKSMMNAAYEGLSELWPTIEKIVALVVEFANKIGAFQKSE